MLSNMFDPGAENEAGWENDIRDDVLEECMAYGHVLHIHVDPFSQVCVCVHVSVSNVLYCMIYTIDFMFVFVAGKCVCEVW